MSQTVTANRVALSTISNALSILGMGAAKNSAEGEVRAKTDRQSTPRRTANSAHDRHSAGSASRKRSRPRSWYRPPTPNPIQSWMAMWGIPVNSGMPTVPFTTPMLGSVPMFGQAMNPWFLTMESFSAWRKTSATSPMDPFGLLGAYAAGLSQFNQLVAPKMTTPLDALASVWGVSSGRSARPGTGFVAPKIVQQGPVTYASYQPPINLPTPVRPWGLYVAALAVPPALHDMLVSWTTQPAWSGPLGVV